MSYRHVTLEERYVIAHLHLHKVSLREIARRLKRHHSTISRELKRNGPPAAAYGPYWYDSAQARCQARKVKARHHRRLHHARLSQYVEQALRATGLHRRSADASSWTILRKHVCASATSRSTAGSTATP